MQKPVLFTYDISTSGKLENNILLIICPHCSSCCDLELFHEGRLFSWFSLCGQSHPLLLLLLMLGFIALKRFACNTSAHSWLQCWFLSWLMQHRSNSSSYLVMLWDPSTRSRCTVQQTGGTSWFLCWEVSSVYNLPSVLLSQPSVPLVAERWQTCSGRQSPGCRWSCFFPLLFLILKMLKG